MPRIRLQDNLVLQHYLLGKFGKQNIGQLAALLRYTDPGYNEENISKYYLSLTSQLNLFDDGFSEQLLEYDRNIYQFTEEINFKRKSPIEWKYFQYLSLLFTEIYLDEYFRDRELLLSNLNKSLDELRATQGIEVDIPNYTEDDINKVALWQATGSGKTLIMHMNILSLQHHMTKHGHEKSYNKILLVTPNEGLSEQHLKEFEESNIPAKRFDDNAQLDFLSSGSDQSVEVIEISKIKEQKGVKTVAVEAFGENNIVLIDEGHKDLKGDERKKMRDRLSNEGFAFEYSATFGQAIKYSNSQADKKQFAEYAKSIIFDYSYKYFYNDGYGKEFKILNLKENVLEQHKFTYMVAALLTYYQQLKIFNINQKKYNEFNISEPLLVFVGASVNAVRTESGQNVSDVIDVLLFIKEFTDKSTQSISAIESIVGGDSGLVNSKNVNIFDGSFAPIAEIYGQDYDSIYRDVIKLVFDSTSADESLIIENLSGSDGEIALRLGTNNHFGLINVGDSSKLMSLCEENGFLTTTMQFSSSLFSEINEKHSPIKILIGSKKFTEGWNSWRVSTMGFLNLGRSEGATIIQLFGRGVRLRGYQDSLKRSNALYPDNLEFKNLLPRNIRKNETLNIFGIRADYMETFRDYLEEEGIESDDDSTYEVEVPVAYEKMDHELKTLGLKDDMPIFKKFIVFNVNQCSLPKNIVELDLYPKLQVIGEDAEKTGARNEHHLTKKDISFINRRELYFDLILFKNSKNWSNLDLDVEFLIESLLDHSWYVIYAPNGNFGETWFKRNSVIQNDIVLPLLKKLLDRIYTSEREKHNAQYREYKKLDPKSDPNFISSYSVKISEERIDISDSLRAIASDIESFENDHKLTNVSGLLHYSKHLYKPLFYINQSGVDYIKTTPTALNEGEEQFIRNLREYTRTNQKFLSDKSIYVLRNQSKGKGIGFFEASNYHPDFIVWIIKDDKQHIAFVDPKGIYNLSEGKNSPKIMLHSEIKKIEKELADSDTTLDSFIITSTQIQSVLWADDWEQLDFERHNVYFSYDDTHIDKIINKIVNT